MKDLSKVDLNQMFSDTGKKKIWAAQQLKVHPSYITIALKATGDKLKEPAIIKLRKKIYDLLTS